MRRRRYPDYRTYRRRRRLFLYVSIPLIILLLLAATVFFLYYQGILMPQDTRQPDVKQNMEITDPTSDDLGETDSSETAAADQTDTDSTDTPETESEAADTPVAEGEVPVTDPATEDTAPDTSDPDPEQTETDVTEEEPEEPFTFENTLFIGDSRTEGLLLNTGLTEATFFAVRGLAVDNIHHKEFIRSDSGEDKLSVMEALETGTWRKIYIMLGVNELGWQSETKFIDAYREVIRCIRERQPEAEIIVQSILPVTKAKSDGDAIYNNPKIYRYNELLETMAAEEEVTWADLVPAVADENGDLPAEGASDGVHLTKSYYQKWLDYLTANEI